MEARQLTKRQSLRGFFVGSVALVLVFASTSAPVPLYELYQTDFEFSDSELSYTFVAYLAGVIATLLFAGRISDAFGRKVVSIAALLFVILGCVLFLHADGIVLIWLARIVQGIAAGLTMSAVSVFVVDTISQYRLSWGAIVVGCGPFLGITIGSISSGLSYELTASSTVIYYAMIASAVLALLLLCLTIEPLSKKASVRSSIKIRLYFKQSLLSRYLVSALVYLSVWSVGGFFLTFSASMASQVFGQDSLLMTSALLACAMGTSILSVPLSARFRPADSLQVCIVLLFASVLLLAIMLNGKALAPFLFAAGCYGVFSGVCVNSVMHLFLQETPLSETSSMISTLNLETYLCSMSMSMLAGFLVNSVSFAEILFIFAGITFVAVIAIVVYVRLVQ